MTNEGAPSLELESPPPQRIFTLNLLNINENEATLTTVGGHEVSVPLNFQPQSAPCRDPAAMRTAAQNERRMRSQAGPLQPLGLHDTVKDLGKTARLLLGRSPRTPLEITTRVIANNEVLPMWRPLVTLIHAPSVQSAPSVSLANSRCHFCRAIMSPVKDEPFIEGPFQWCFFCNDAPAWHHGWCCPYNWNSDYTKGASHKERYEIAWHNQRRRIEGRKPIPWRWHYCNVDR